MRNYVLDPHEVGQNQVFLNILVFLIFISQEKYILWSINQESNIGDIRDGTPSPVTYVHEFNNNIFTIIIAINMRNTGNPPPYYSKTLQY